jgi:hypothetical protein
MASLLIEHLTEESNEKRRLHGPKIWLEYMCNLILLKLFFLRV